MVCPGGLRDLLSPACRSTHSFGSGSSGNCTYLETAECRLLIDAGLSGRQIRQRLLASAGRPESLTGILITHEHTDHTQALGVLAAKLNIPVYCNRLTQEAIAAQFPARFEFRLFSTGADFEVGDLRVETFSVPHDAPGSGGIHDPHRRGGHWHPDRSGACHQAGDRARADPANLLVLESNHDCISCRPILGAPGAPNNAF